MQTKFLYSSSSLFLFLFCFPHPSQAQPAPSTPGYTCSRNQTPSPCQTYAFYRAAAPDLLDLASIADLFWVSRLMISRPSNISSPSSPLQPGHPLFVPITCSCNPVRTNYSISYANLTYTIKRNDTLYKVSTYKFLNLTTYQSVEAVNPTLIPAELEVGDNLIFPAFCKCPDQTQKQNNVSYLISYVFQPSDTLQSVATRFGVRTRSISDVNGNRIQPFDTVFIPVSQLPHLSQADQTTVLAPPPPSPPPAPLPKPERSEDRKGVITGLAIALGITGFLFLLINGVWIYREKKVLMKKRGEEEKRRDYNRGGKGWKEMQEGLMADVSDCLDKYRVFTIDELREATNGFAESHLIEGSVYKGRIGKEEYAIKMMKWNAYDELKILQKVNHGNLVKLEGFCIDPEDANCYLIYEYLENGSLHSWLHENNTRTLNWKTRLRIAIDVANGLQYIHEHTRPQVVHKDIKSSNILLDSNMRAKIANFGLAKSGCNAITMHIVGTQGYIAPEYLADGVVTTKMDVFSFGVVLLELVSRREAIDKEGEVLWESGAMVMKGSDEEGNLEWDKRWMDKSLIEDSCVMDSVMNVMTVAIACVDKDPSKRPNMVEIVYTLCKSDELVYDEHQYGSLSAQSLTR